MSDETTRPEKSGSNSVPNGEKLRQTNVSHEQFNLKSSQTQPFDTNRMEGKPTNSNNKPTPDSVSESENK